MAKFVYTSLFSWLVEAINRSLEGNKEHTTRSISILDMYGFESVQVYNILNVMFVYINVSCDGCHLISECLLQKNSFEQMLINYADERLHQHFVRHLFKLEQDVSVTCLYSFCLSFTHKINRNFFLLGI